MCIQYTYTYIDFDFCKSDIFLTLKGRGYFTNEKKGGGIMAHTFISARSNGKMLIF